MTSARSGGGDMRKKPESHLVERAEAIRLSAPDIETFADELPLDPKEVEP